MSDSYLIMYYADGYDSPSYFPVHDADSIVDAIYKFSKGVERDPNVDNPKDEDDIRVAEIYKCVTPSDT